MGKPAATSPSPTPSATRHSIHCTRFLFGLADSAAYGGERIADILTLKLLRQYSDRTDALGTVAGAYWAVLLPSFAEDWHFFEPISVPEFTIMGGQPFFRMAYRYQTDEEECILSEVALASVSSSFPNKRYGFVTTNAVCEDILAQYSAEREAMLNSFRP